MLQHSTSLRSSYPFARGREIVVTFWPSLTSSDVFVDIPTTQTPPCHNRANNTTYTHWELCEKARFRLWPFSGVWNCSPKHPEKQQHQQHYSLCSCIFFTIYSTTIHFPLNQYHININLSVWVYCAIQLFVFFNSYL